MQDTVVLVTGANSGIGRETAKALAAAGATTVLACRDGDKAERAAHDIREETGNKAVHTACVDLGDLRNVAACAEDVVGRFERIDVLVNNAGGYWDVRHHRAGLRAAFRGQLPEPLPVDAPHPVLERGRVAAARRQRDVCGPPGGAGDGLGRSPVRARLDGVACLRSVEACPDPLRQGACTALRGQRLVAHAAHPGVVRSNFAEDGDTSGAHHLLVRAIGVFGVSPRAGARTSVHLASSAPAARSNGDYWVRRTRHRPSKGALDDAAARRLWDVSESLVTGVGVAV